MVQKHLRLDGVAIHSALHAVGGHHRQVQCLAGLGLGLEGVGLVAQVLLVFLADFVLVLGKLHLTQINDVVAAVDDKVDLRAALAVAALREPRGVFGEDARNAQLPLDLRDMLQTQGLESQSCPCVVGWRGQGVRPIVFVFAVMLLHETVIEQGVEIRKAVERVFLVAAEIAVGLDEIAAAEVFQQLGERSAVGDFGGFDQLAARQPLAFPAEGRVRGC